MALPFLFKNLFDRIYRINMMIEEKANGFPSCPFC